MDQEPAFPNRVSFPEKKRATISEQKILEKNRGFHIKTSPTMVADIYLIIHLYFLPADNYFHLDMQVFISLRKKRDTHPNAQGRKKRRTKIIGCEFRGNASMPKTTNEESTRSCSVITIVTVIICQSVLVAPGEKEISI